MQSPPVHTVFTLGRKQLSNNGLHAVFEEPSHSQQDSFSLAKGLAAREPGLLMLAGRPFQSPSLPCSLPKKELPPRRFPFPLPSKRYTGGRTRRRRAPRTPKTQSTLMVTRPKRKVAAVTILSSRLFFLSGAQKFMNSTTAGRHRWQVRPTFKMVVRQTHRECHRRCFLTDQDWMFVDTVRNAHSCLQVWRAR